MKLENQVCSLELAKKLKKLGVKQESLWWWIYAEGKWNLFRDDNCSRKNTYSAFTVAELGKRLPITCHSTRFEQGYEFQCHYQLWNMEKEEMDYLHHTADKTEASARAKMLIYLIENKLIKI